MLTYALMLHYYIKLNVIRLHEFLETMAVIIKTISKAFPIFYICLSPGHLIWKWRARRIIHNCLLYFFQNFHTAMNMQSLWIHTCPTLFLPSPLVWNFINISVWHLCPQRTSRSKKMQQMHFSLFKDTIQ